MNVVDTIGWTLLNFLWQGALVGMVYALLCRQARSPLSRYALGLGALVGCALAPVLTLWWLWPVQIVGGAVQRLPDWYLAASSSRGVDVWAWLDALLPWLVGVWGVGVAWLGARSFSQWWRLLRARRCAVGVVDWQSRLIPLAQRFGIDRPIALFATAAVQVPTLFGVLKPAILLPTALLLRLPPSQLELILAHELCHVRRWDYLVNLGQVALETLLFYHPIVHWLSARVRADRELCCDETVLSVMDAQPSYYAEVLADLAAAAVTHVAPAANGGILIERIETLLLPRARQPRPSSALLIATIAVAVLLVLGLRQSLVSEPNFAVIALSAKRLPVVTTASSGARTITRLIVAEPQRPVSPSPAVSTARPMRSIKSTAFIRHLRTTTTLKPTTTFSLQKREADAPAQQEMPGTHQSIEAVPLRGNGFLIALTSAPEPMSAIPVTAANPSARTTTLPSMPMIGAGPATKTPYGAAITPAQESAAAAPPMPRLLHVVSAVYSEALRDRDVQGRVEMQFHVAADGRVQDVAVLDGSSHPQLTAAAVTALRQWRFVPGSAEAGHAYRQTINFSLAAEQSNACRVMTGSHICRRDSDAADASGVKVVN